eukprot:1174898-Amphidinium_carterae.3
MGELNAVRPRLRIRRKRTFLDRTQPVIVDEIPVEGHGYMHADDPLDSRLHDPEYWVPPHQDGATSDTAAGYDQGGEEPLPKRMRLSSPDWTQIESLKTLLTLTELTTCIPRQKHFKEVQWQKLTDPQSLNFERRFEKNGTLGHWDVWEQYAPTRPLTGEKVNKVKSGQLAAIPTRWVFVWKDKGPVNGGGKKAKARLVVQGPRTRKAMNGRGGALRQLHSRCIWCWCLECEGLESLRIRL